MVKSNDKRGKFVRLAEGRTQAALNALRKIGNLSNQRAYDYNEADIRKIVRVLKDAVNEIERKFSASGDQQDKFKL